ncbi:MAG: hypothetical protein WDN00_03135 [Limisphaerales bacterium]
MVLINNKLIVGGQNFLKRVSYDGILDTNFTTGNFFNSSQTEVMLPEPGGNVIVGGSSYGVRRLWLEPAPIVVPTFSSGSGVTLVNGQFQLSACGGVDGQNVVVQASSDLVNWVSVSTNVVFRRLHQLHRSANTGSAESLLPASGIAVNLGARLCRRPAAAAAQRVASSTNPLPPGISKFCGWSGTTQPRYTSLATIKNCQMAAVV